MSKDVRERKKDLAKIESAIEKVKNDILNGTTKLLYVAPESLTNLRVASILKIKKIYIAFLLILEKSSDKLSLSLLTTMSWRKFPIE